jgi:TonB-linked SusC/RagA family outer membrane protein
MKKLLLISLSFFLLEMGYAKQERLDLLKGQVLQLPENTPMPGVNVVLKGTSKGVVSDTDGRFSIPLQPGSAVLSFSFIGFLNQEVEVDFPNLKEIKVFLQPDEISLSEFQVLSTGFEELPAERATGSFVQIDNELLNRRVGPSILNRLEDITPGVIFNRDRADLAAGESISIRGNSTLLASRNPLIVVDNLAYDGPIENINPNDVESITVLRDAAAASIWGARAGNGVIVIKTKRGKFDSPMRLSWNSNLTIGEAFNPFYNPQMSISDFVDVERKLFENGVFQGQENGFGNPKLSPVSEDLIAFRDGKISQVELDRKLNQYKTQDSRQDLASYFYRPSAYQQYALQVDGGSQNYSYLVSLGLDQNKETRKTDQNNRITVNTQQNWNLMNGKLRIGLGAYLIQTNRENGSPDLQGIEAYDRLADENGEGLPILWKYSSRFKADLADTGTLDWDYYPLRELGLNPETSILNEIRINPRLEWDIVKGISFVSNYQYWTGNSETQRLNNTSSFFTRNLINQFTEIGVDGGLTNRVPLGSIYDFSRNRSFSHNWRNQINLSKNINDHSINGLIGMEIKDFQSEGNFGRAYGYDEETGLSRPMDFLNFYPDLTTGFSNQIPFRQGFTGSINRYISYFSNVGYSFKDRYSFTASARLDGSNLFGVATNNRVVPLWSVGAGWIISEESWMNWEALDYLKVKSSFGYNGNTNPAATAYTTAIQFDASTNRWVGEPWLSVISPPNPELRWERIKITNVGLEFELFKGRINGGIEYYNKAGLDLFGAQAIYPSSGVTSIVRNYASTITNGLDLTLGGKITNGDLKWTVNFFYSNISEKVTDFDLDPIPVSIASYSSGLSGIIPSPVKGYPLYSIFRFPFAGLDSDTGAPLGILNGEPSTDYSGILAETELEDLIFHGSAIPTHFGAFRNQFGYKGFDLSFNISYRLGYYFSRESIVYDNLNRGQIGHLDYENRWKASGDELTTQIPSDPGQLDPLRNSFDLYSSRSIRKGDHIRFQDIQFSYTFADLFPTKPGTQIQIYSYVNNIGILWKAAKDVVDPDFRNFQAPRTYSIGLKINY